jgi:hypothetical protein
MSASALPAVFLTYPLSSPKRYQYTTKSNRIWAQENPSTTNFIYSILLKKKSKYKMKLSLTIFVYVLIWLVELEESIN